ncbi:MAG: CoA transferase [Dehalococcoidia bacterium]|nr:CoA transferase [Dehalococcoidia bacterium]
MPGPLDGILVLDLTWIVSGPYSTMMLADLGANVIKVERPGYGDAARGTAPIIGEDSAYFMSLNRNKRSLALDLQKPRGREVFLKLVLKADVVISNFTPGTMERLGIGYDDLSKINPRLIYCTVSGFGQTGPYKERSALDIVVQAMGGIMSITGEDGGKPVRVGAPVGDINAGMTAALGICAALVERAKSGKGQAVDVSMLDCQVALVENAVARHVATGEVPGPLGTRHAVLMPFQVFPTRDGSIVVAIAGSNPGHWPLFCASIGHVELIDDPRFLTPWERTVHHKDLEPVIAEALKTRTTQEWLDEFLAAQLPCGPLQNIPQVMSDPQVQHREMIVEMEHPRLGPWKFTGVPIKLSRTPGKVRILPPDLGQHTDELLASLGGLTQQEIEQLHRDKVVEA